MELLETSSLTNLNAESLETYNKNVGRAHALHGLVAENIARND
jgi:hypothetical protein